MYAYRINVEHVLLNGVETVLFKSLDTLTKLLLDAYNPTITLKRKLSSWLGLSVLMLKWLFPDSAHTHEWHFVLATAALKDLADSKSLAMPLVSLHYTLAFRQVLSHYASENMLMPAR